MYPQGGGAEQASFERETGAAQARSKRIVSAIAAGGLLSEQGLMLDVGCGNGNMLRSFQETFPAWSLSGLEWDDRHRAVVQEITNVTDFHTDFPDFRQNSFDLISMIHVLEHIANPVPYLRRLSRLLRNGGRLLIEVPNLRRNPYDLAIFDHCSHFTATSLQGVLARAGLQPEWLSEDVVSKELTVLCRIAAYEASPAAPEDVTLAGDSLSWLHTFTEKAKAVADKPLLGIFGTSIGASWVVSTLGRAPDFFLDEDPNRIGLQHLEKPIIAPAEAPRGATVIIPLTTESAATVASRISRPDLDLMYLS